MLECNCLAISVQTKEGLQRGDSEEENSNTMSLSEAIKAAIKTCIGKNILVSFLKRNGSEVENMLLSEWNMKDALEVAKEEGKEEGIEIGEARSESRGIKKLSALLRQGYSLDEAEKMLGIAK
jgi:hypothetical protein